MSWREIIPLRTKNDIYDTGTTNAVTDDDDMQYNISTPVDHNMKNNCNGTSSFLDNDFDDDNDDGDQSKLLSSLFDDDANNNDNDDGDGDDNDDSNRHKKTTMAKMQWW